MYDDTLHHAVHNPVQPEPPIVLVTLSSDDWVSDLNYCENDADISSNGVTYTAGHVGISLPSEGQNDGRGVLAIDNYEGNISPLVLAAEEVLVTAKLVLFYSPDIVRREWPELLWRQVSCTPIARGSLIQRSYARELWGPKVHNEIDFPGSRW